MVFLIVDDSKTARMITKRALHLAGYADDTMLEAENGRAAVEVAKNNSVDMILSDWNMPDMTGIEMVNALRLVKIQVPVGLITTKGSPAERAEAEAAGVRFVILKTELNEKTLKSALGQIF